MHRFYLPPSRCQGPVLVLNDREAHHAWQVLRLRGGEPVTVLDGAGGHYLCEVSAASRGQIQLTVKQRDAIPPLPYAITLLQAIPKGKGMDSIIQKATELGAARVVPLLSERVVSQLDQERSEKKAEHWRQVAIEAIKQCGSAWLPEIDPPIPLKTWLEGNEAFELSLIASLAGERKHPREWFQAFERQHGRRPATIATWVGPEGDFTAAETAAVLALGARPITLGPLILRSETAAIYCLSVINYEMQQNSRSSA